MFPSLRVASALFVTAFTSRRAETWVCLCRVPNMQCLLQALRCCTQPYFLSIFYFLTVKATETAARTPATMPALSPWVVCPKSGAKNQPFLHYLVSCQNLVTKKKKKKESWFVLKGSQWVMLALNLLYTNGFVLMQFYTCLGLTGEWTGHSRA